MTNPAKQRGDYGIENHYVICNWTPKADVIVRQLHNESVHDKKPIIVITRNPEQVPQTTDKEYRGLLMICGDPADREILQRADVRHAQTVIVLADETDLANADAKSILIALAVDSINPNAHVVVELVKSQNKMYFEYTHVNEIVCLEQLAEKLLSQTALTPGLSQVYMDLLTQSADTNEIYQEVVPSQFVGKPYIELEQAINANHDLDVIIIGFATRVQKMKGNIAMTNGGGKAIMEQKIVINPPKDSVDSPYTKSYKLNEEDTVFLIAYEKPELSQYFNVRN